MVIANYLYFSLDTHMIARYLFVLAIATSFLQFGAPCRADDSAAVRADLLMSTLQQSEFGDAGKFFHYPENYTAAELLEDQEGVAQFLRTLFGELGNIESLSRISRPNGLFLQIGVFGGDIPYWSSHPELNTTIDVMYRARSKNDGDVFFVVTLIHPKFVWEVHTVLFEIPASQKGASERMSMLGRKLMPPPPKPPLKGA